jgi:signal peptidase I
MFNFLLPRKTKKVLDDAELIHSSLRRNRIYSQDTLSKRDLDTLSELDARYEPLRKARDVAGLEKLNADSLRIGNKLFPPSPWDGWRENVEVFVVSAIMALAVRSFFLQPFKIPTGSMEPTLYGIEPRLSTELPPNPAVRAWDFIIHGKSYSRVVTKQGGEVTGLDGGTIFIWFEYTNVHLTDSQGNQETDRIWIRPGDVERRLGIYPVGSGPVDDHGQPLPAKVYKPGDVLADYITQTGDQVLVDKVTYNFRPPLRGEVFIFKTAGIAGLEGERGPDQEGSEDFIKRCVGLAGDIIQVKPPALLVNGAPATGAAVFAKQAARTDDYPGYTLVNYESSSYLSTVASQCVGTTADPNRKFDPYDKGNSQTYYVPADCYWAMGDNSPNSEDSRYWGGVPRQNLIGRGYFVFWPFTSRWGWIK